MVLFFRDPFPSPTSFKPGASFGFRDPNPRSAFLEHVSRSPLNVGTLFHRKSVLRPSRALVYPWLSLSPGSFSPLVDGHPSLPGFRLKDPTFSMTYPLPRRAGLFFIVDSRSFMQSKGLKRRTRRPPPLSHITSPFFLDPQAGLSHLGAAIGCRRSQSRPQPSLFFNPMPSPTSSWPPLLARVFEGG